jgi:hypothetical protein
MLRRVKWFPATVVWPVILASCAGPGSGTPPAGGNADASAFVRETAPTITGCYPNIVPERTVNATITFYGWPDNTPPGKSIAHPVIHQHAGGMGTYCNPTTFATEPTKKENALIPYGTRIYVPFIEQYFIREDDCTPSGPPVGNGNNGCYQVWFDLWVGGSATSNTNAVVNCEDELTPSSQQPIILSPPDWLPVRLPGPIYSDDPAPAGTCDGLPGNTSPP